MLRSIDSNQPILPTTVSWPSAQLYPEAEIDQTRTFDCSPLPHQPLQKVESFRNYLLYRNITELSKVTGDYDSPFAICKLDMREGSGWMTHFPHVMQHLYACYSFWMERPSKKPVLLTLGIRKLAFANTYNKNPFLKGFMELLESQLGVQILSSTEIENLLWEHNHTTRTESMGTEKNVSGKEGGNRLVPVIPKIVEISRPLGYVLSHVRKLNEMAMIHYNIGGGTTQQLTKDRIANKTQIKIGFLDRKVSSGRSVINAKDLIQSIESEFLSTGDRTNNTKIALPSFAEVSSTVSLEYFEGKNTLEEQIRFFNSIDILVSPHGAQLTGIPFMANKECTRLIEFFPDRYFLPDFYGSLAIDSGIGYSHVYFSQEAAEVQSRKYGTAVFQRIVTPSIEKRTKHRAQNLCIDTSVVLDAIQNAFQDWGKCQQERQKLLGIRHHHGRTKT